MWNRLKLIQDSFCCIKYESINSLKIWQFRRNLGDDKEYRVYELGIYGI